MDKFLNRHAYISLRYKLGVELLSHLNLIFSFLPKWLHHFVLSPTFTYIFYILPIFVISFVFIMATILIRVKSYIVVLGTTREIKQGAYVAHDQPWFGQSTAYGPLNPLGYAP